MTNNLLSENATQSPWSNKNYLLNSGRDFVTMLSFLVIFIYTLFFFPFAFNYEIYKHGFYTIALFSIVSTCLWSLFILLDRRTLIRKSDLLIIPIMGCQLYWIHNGNEYASTTASMGLFFFQLRLLPVDKFKLLIYAIVVVYTAQILFVSYTTLITGSIGLEGSFNNTGVYSIYCVLFIPIFYYVTRQNLTGWYFNITFGIYLALVLSIVILTKSRTAMIALFLVYGIPTLLGWLKKSSNLAKLLSTGCLTFIFSGAFYYLFHLKSGSSLGRILMLKIATSNIPENLFWGVGLGRFTWNYPQWQANFFKTNINPDMDFLLNAGETYVIFNEFVQLFISIGAIFFMILVFIWIRFLRKTSQIQSDLIKEIRRIFFIILCCSLTYYALHINAILLLLFFFIALSDRLITDPISDIRGYSNNFFKAPILLVALFSLLFIYPKHMALCEWDLVKKEIHPSSEKALSYVHSKLKNDGKFLADYGNYLYEHSEDKATATQAFEDSKKSFISKESIEILAYLYLEQKDYEKAIEQFEWLVNYLPSRFGYRLELIRLYQTMHKIKKAKALAASTLLMPVKIPSDEVTIIKSQISEINKQLSLTK